MEDHSLDPALTVGLALALGISAQALARRLNVPGIVLLLLFGVVAGPDLLGIVRPEALGHGLHTVVGLAVSVILFEGGMSLSVRRLKEAAGPIRKLVTLGAAITFMFGMLLAHFLLEWRWKTSILFGTLVMVTGPTVINPLLRRIRVTTPVHTVLEAEGVLVDAVGAVLAVVALEMVLKPVSEDAVVSGVAGLVQRWGVGLLVGLAGGALVGAVLRKKLLPEGMSNAFTLAFAAAIFTTSNAFASESGIVAVIVAGLIVGNLGVEDQRELLEFKEQLSVMLVGLLFVLLAADVRLKDVAALGFKAILLVAVLMLVARPAAVFASTMGASLSLRERLFISWLAPRGIVAAAVASLFAQRMEATGMEGGIELRSLVFLVIFMTVVIQGATGGIVASALSVRRRAGAGVVMLGANPFARWLALELKRMGEEVLMVDVNPDHCRRAEEDGLKVIFGNALDERTLQRAQVDSRRACIAATGNESINLLFARTLRRLFKVGRTLTLVHRARLGVRMEDVRGAHAEALFGKPVDLDAWASRVSRGEAAVLSVTGAADQNWKVLEDAAESLLLPFVVRDKDELTVYGSDTVIEPARKPVVIVLAATERVDEAISWLRSQGLDAVRQAPPRH